MPVIKICNIIDLPPGMSSLQIGSFVLLADDTVAGYVHWDEVSATYAIDRHVYMCVCVCRVCGCAGVCVSMDVTV